MLLYQKSIDYCELNQMLFLHDVLMYTVWTRLNKLIFLFTWLMVGDVSIN